MTKNMPKITVDSNGSLRKAGAKPNAPAAPKSAPKVEKPVINMVDTTKDAPAEPPKEKYAERLKKLPRHKRIAMKTTSTMKRLERFSKMTAGWSDNVKSTALAAVASVAKFVEALESLPADFVAPENKAARSGGIATGTPVTLTEKALGKYKKLLADDGVDMSKPFVVTSYASGKVGVKTADGSKFFFNRGEIQTQAEAAEAEDTDDSDDEEETAEAV